MTVLQMANDRLDSVCPIFLERHGTEDVDLIGSGVLLKVDDEVFLLTAAHVTDQEEYGHLLIPGKNGLTGFGGHFAHLAVPAGAARNKDSVDIAYFRLDKDSRESLHSSLKALDRGDVILNESIMEEDVYSFVGYPWRKVKITNTAAQTLQFAYSGTAVAPTNYGSFGYDPNIHIVIQFRRNKSFDMVTERWQVPPLPHGISGGGIFAWPKHLAQPFRKEIERSLVGIGHTYNQSKHLLIGTRISAYLACIFRNNTRLGQLEMQRVSETAIPMILGIAWYKRNQWQQLLSEFADADHMHKTWSEWRQAAENGLEQLSRRGTIAYPVLLDAEEITRYCQERRLPNIGKTRLSLVNEKLAKLTSENPT